MSKYKWKAIYKNGDTLDQVNTDGSKNGYGDIDRSQLVGFELWDGKFRVFYTKIEPGQRLIWRRRTEMIPGQGQGEVVHIVGKQETIDGENIQGIVCIFESDGRMEATDRFDPNHPWLYPVQPIPEENEEWQMND